MSIRQLTTVANKSFLNLSCRNLNDFEETFTGNTTVDTLNCDSLTINGTIPITFYSETYTTHTFDPSSFVFTTPQFVNVRLTVLNNIVSYSIDPIIALSNGSPLGEIIAPNIIPLDFRPPQTMVWPSSIKDGSVAPHVLGYVEIDQNGTVRIWSDINKSTTYRANDLVGLNSFDCFWFI